jgi:hypothetical protein
LRRKGSRRSSTGLKVQTSDRSVWQWCQTVLVIDRRWIERPFLWAAKRDIVRCGATKRVLGGMVLNGLRYLVIWPLAMLFVVNAALMPASHSQNSALMAPELAAYLAAGGSWEDICADGTAPHAHPDCPFCRELELAVLSDPPQTPARGLTVFVANAPLLPAPEIAQVARPNNPARAPPHLA